MHKYRRQAKFAAWYDDPNEIQESSSGLIRNPFAKYRAPTNGSRKNTLTDEERGLRPLNTVQTNPEHASGKDGEHPRSHKHAATSPSASSNTKPYAAGDGVVIPEYSSPTQSLKDQPVGGEKHAPESTGETLAGDLRSSSEKEGSVKNRGDKKKHGIKDLLHKSSDSDESPVDDDNGKGKHQKFTVMGQIRATLFNSWINVLLICSPIGIALHFAGVKPVAIFVVNFIAIIPLAAMLSYATEEIALRTGEVIGGLLNASFGNAVELIVSVIALVKNQVLIVQTSLIGSMLSNLLLVMGMCFFFGGINRMEQAFNMTVAQTAASLLFLAVSSLIIPTAFDQWAQTGQTTVDPSKPKAGVADLSRGTSIMLLIVYACYLFFQLKSHSKMFSEPSQKNEKRDAGGKFKSALIPTKFRSKKNAQPQREVEDDEDEEEAEQPQLSILVAVLTLAASTVLVALNAEFLVDSINEITCGGHISKSFVGLILLPIVGNAAEHATAVTVACKDKMDLAIGVAVGSSMQIALLVLPFVVVLGWIMGKDDMTLFFDGFQIAVLFVAVLLVNYLIQDGKSHWLEGVLLMTLYIIIAVAAWFYPTSPKLSDCPT